MFRQHFKNGVFHFQMAASVLQWSSKLVKRCSRNTEKSTEALLGFSLYFFLRNNDYQIKVIISQVFYKCVKQPLGLAKRKVNNLEKTSTKVVISWFRLAGMEFCPVLPGSRQCYKFFKNFIFQLHVTSFIPARRNPSFELPGCRFAGNKFSYCLSAMKKSINTSVWKIYRSTFQ